MAISTTNDQYIYAKKRADETLHRSFRATVDANSPVAMSASESGSTSANSQSERPLLKSIGSDQPFIFLSPALCSTSNDFFIRNEPTFNVAVGLAKSCPTFKPLMKCTDIEINLNRNQTNGGARLLTPRSSRSQEEGSISGQISSLESTAITSTFAANLNQQLQRIYEDYDIPNRAAMSINPFHSTRRYPATPKTNKKRKEKNHDHIETVLQLTNIIFQQLAEQTDTAVNSTKQPSSRTNTNDGLSPKEQFEKFGSTLPKKVCQHQFKRNDIVWVCRTCQADETCVLCHACFNASSHENHDVAFYHAQAGGCCDCGDPDAWDPKGFCPLHGKDLKIVLEKDLECRVRGVVDYCVEFLNGFSENVENAYNRANGTGEMYTNVHVTANTSRDGKRKFGRSMSDGSGIEDEDDTENAMRTDNMSPIVRNLHRSNTAPVTSVREAMDASDQSFEMSISDQEMDVVNEVEEASNIASAVVTSASIPAQQQSPRTPERNSVNANVDECKFDPAAASASKSRLNRSLHSNGSNEIPTHGNIDRKEINSGKSCDNDESYDEVEKFDPKAASTSKSQLRDKSNIIKKNMTPAQYLGLLGSQEEGLFLLLHADDVHKSLDITTALRSLYLSYPQNHSERTLDSISNKIADLFQQDLGDLIVWGTQELMNELGPVLSSCWKDGDATACRRFGALMMEKASILTGVGMVVSIKTRKELCEEIRCAAILDFLNLMSDCCDPFCRLVSVGLGAEEVPEADKTDIDKDEDNRIETDFPSKTKTMDVYCKSSTSHLTSMLQTDLKLPRKIAKSWHDLLLTLLAVPNFKAALANAYVDTYSAVTREYAQGIGIFDKSSYTLSVQFLNRVTYVEDLVKQRDLLGCLVRSLFGTLSVAIKTTKSSTEGDSIGRISAPNRSATWTINMIHDVIDDYLNPLGPRNSATWGFRREETLEPGQAKPTRLNPVLDPLHPILTHRRYSPCIGDLKCVLNVPGVANLFSSIPKLQSGRTFQKRCLLDAWIETLSLLQNMDTQRWRRVEQGHVEQEPRDWVGAFNAGIAIGSLYERILSWEDNDKDSDSSLFRVYKESTKFLSIVELTKYILLNGIDSWQSAEALSFIPTTHGSIPEFNCPVCLPMSTVAADCGAPMAMKTLPVAQSQVWSFHLPLHRFVAASLREVSRRPYQLNDGQPGGFDQLIQSLKQTEGARKLYRIYLGLLEYPTIILARNSQIRSQLWLRNGKLMFDQVLNYGEPHFCKGLRDADLALIQFAFVGLSSLSQAELDAATNADERRYKAFSCAHLINLLLHRFGVFLFAGFSNATESYEERYWDDVKKGEYPPEKQMGNETKTLPWCYSAADDPIRHKSMLEEFLFTLIILITELYSPPPVDHADHTLQAKARLRREVVHRLASGPKAHSELAEVHHVLPMRDNMILSEEGKCVNPDDATGAALEAALVDVAECKSFKGKSDKWELQRWAWNEYDPAFFHLSLRQHQNASEFRPNGLDSKDRRITPMPYAPFPPTGHKNFVRLRKDVTSDACIIAMLYRALHIHCRDCDSDGMFQKTLDSEQREAYNSEAMSETILGRVIHLLTLGSYAWEGAHIDSNWRESGGGDIGSVFHDFVQMPTQSDWVQKVLLADPSILMSCSAYKNQKNTLQLLQNLASNGGSEHFEVQDRSIRGGAAWLCDYATRNNKEAANLLGDGGRSTQGSGIHDSLEADKQRRSREAKERAMKMFNIKMTEFARSIEVSSEGENMDFPHSPGTSSLVAMESIDGDLETPKTSDSRGEYVESPIGQGPSIPTFHKANNSANTVLPGSIPRLLHERPRCIICADDGADSQDTDPREKSTGKAKKNILTMCGYIQASTVARQQLVGTHISLCGHAIHVSCCESHLRDSGHDRYLDRHENSKRADFRCPLCRGLTNCLIPFVDVAKGWAVGSSDSKDGQHDTAYTLDNFLDKSKWWTARNDSLFQWNGRCSFLPKNLEPEFDGHEEPSIIRTKSFGKKDLYRAWSTVLWTHPNTGRIALRGQDNTGDRGTSQSHSSTGVTVIWRRILDQLSEISYKVDAKRIGESDQFPGEFRHYLVEKFAYMEEDVSPAVLDSVDWPSCVIPFPSPEVRQGLSREKLISKQLLSIQALTYTCCSEAIECNRLARESTSANLETVLAKFGVKRFACNGNFIIMPMPSVGDGTQLFDGKIGRLRYFALPVLVATSPLARELVHICMDLPVPFNASTTYEEDTSPKRAEICSPILYGNILTRVVTAICSVTGKERARSEAMGTAQSFMTTLASNIVDLADESTVQDCLHFIQLGFIARILQVVLGVFQQEFTNGVTEDWTIFEHQMVALERLVSGSRYHTSRWEIGCAIVLQSAFSRQAPSPAEPPSKNSVSHLHALFSKACQEAKHHCLDYICHVGFILQVLLPKSISIFENMEGSRKESPENVDNCFDIFGLQDLKVLIESPLVMEIIAHWYERARPRAFSTSLETRLDCEHIFKVNDWPHLYISQFPLITKLPPGHLPLLKGNLSEKATEENINRLSSLPMSYTDLYATLSSMLPDSELTAVCFVCGQVLNATGKGECTKHAYKCGGGCGIFFILQECICLAIHKDSAVYITSPYVDSHGETPQYRGRPLNMDKSRYDFLHSLWSGHLLRAHVIAERSKSPRHRLIANNFY